MKSFIITIYCINYTIIIKLGNINNLLPDNNLIYYLFKFNHNIKYKILEPALEFKPLYICENPIQDTVERYSQLHFMLESIKILDLSDKLIQTLIYIIIHYPYVLLPLSILIIKTIINKILSFKYDDKNYNIIKILTNVLPKHSFFNKSDKANLLKKTQPYNRNYIVNMADNNLDLDRFDPYSPENSRVPIVAPNRIRWLNQVRVVRRFDQDRYGENPNGYNRLGIYRLGGWTELLPSVEGYLAVGHIFEDTSVEILRRINDIILWRSQIERLIHDMESHVTQLNNYINNRGVSIVYDEHNNLSIDVPTNITDEEAYNITQNINNIDSEIIRIRTNLTPHLDRLPDILNDINTLPNLETFPEGMVDSISKFSQWLTRYHTVEYNLNNLYKKS